ncbi:amidohydrolase [Spirillospora sp. NPDC029432]|uniref:amidohydrolase n=1 Tax=Spirillospora sp. NPDC029432 TaxID=3154599 RepID=UPI00345663F3
MTDLIFTGGPIVTVAPGDPEAEALAVTGGVITAVGRTADVMPLRTRWTRVADLAGRALLPGFVEPHGHPVSVALCLAPPSVDVRPFTVPTAAEVVDRTRAALDAAAPGEPLMFYGIDVLLQNGLERPTKDRLDAIAPRNPVVVLSNSGHSAWGNSAMLALAGITRDTPAPPGSEIVLGPDGEPTGEVRETPAVVRMTSPVAEAARSTILDRLRWSYARHAAAGLTTVAELGFNPAFDPALAALAAEPGCPIRVRAYEVGTPENAADPAHLAPPRPSADAAYARIGMKVWADGTPWHGDIATTFPYLDTDATRRLGLGPCHQGGMNHPPERLAELAAAYTRQGWQLACHVHGDVSADAVLDAYERARPLAPAGWRPRMEHCGALRPDQFARAASLGVTASLFIQHVYYWGDVLMDDLFGSEHGARWMSARSALDAGLRVSLHNDGQCSPADPIGNIATAVNRRTRITGRVLAPEQRLTVDEALRAQTIDAAWQLHLDDAVGSLEPGKRADLVVVSGNPRAVPPEALYDLRVEATYYSGRATFAA